jgi:dimeric dUTPase (all-alpha-NTP-PPase superfamily)
LIVKSDKLEEIFALQKELNKRIGVDSDLVSKDPEESTKWILNYSRALGQENAELVDSVPWKWWAKYQDYDLQNAKVEVVDMLHFLVSLAQVMGMDAEEVFELYTKKHKLNHKRQDDGYAVKNEEDNRSL